MREEVRLALYVRKGIIGSLSGPGKGIGEASWETEEGGTSDT